MVPKFKHKRTDKKVQALQIKEINVLPTGGARLSTNTAGYGSFEVSPWYMKKQSPVQNGYYLIHETGKTTFVGEEEFKNEYTPIEEMVKTTAA